jgi:DNA-binding PucR family transcriptional regulator
VKYRIYPKKSVVLVQFNERLLVAKDAFTNAAERLDKFRSSMVVQPGGLEEQLEHLADVAEAEMDRLLDIVELLESHEPAEVAVEIEEG